MINIIFALFLNFVKMGAQSFPCRGAAGRLSKVPLLLIQVILQEGLIQGLKGRYKDLYLDKHTVHVTPPYLALANSLATTFSTSCNLWALFRGASA